MQLHSMIEHCIVHGLRREETIEYLRNTVGVDRVFSAIVWDQLRAQNASFFANLDADDEPVHARYMHRGHMPQDYRGGNHSVCMLHFSIHARIPPIARFNLLPFVYIFPGPTD